MKFINFSLLKSLECKEARFFQKFFGSRYGTGTGTVTFRESEPQSKELVRGPPELVQHFRL
jgi:hypothetical protein